MRWIAAGWVVPALEPPHRSRSMILCRIPGPSRIQGSTIQAQSPGPCAASKHSAAVTEWAKASPTGRAHTWAALVHGFSRLRSARPDHAARHECRSRGGGRTHDVGRERGAGKGRRRARGLRASRCKDLRPDALRAKSRKPFGATSKGTLPRTTSRPPTPPRPSLDASTDALRPPMQRSRARVRGPRQPPHRTCANPSRSRGLSPHSR